jgi:polyhydroxybutyrate depolymerase
MIRLRAQKLWGFLGTQRSPNLSFDCDGQGCRIISNIVNPLGGSEAGTSKGTIKFKREPDIEEGNPGDRLRWNYNRHCAALVFGVASNQQNARQEQLMEAGDLQGELEVDNLRRSYRLHIPRTYDSRQPTPLVLAFHGRLGTGNKMEKLTNLSALADKQGFIVVYPNGVGRSWNAGHGTGKAEAKGVDDVKSTVMLIDSLSQTLNIDHQRVYATGFSNGATFVHRLACELSEKIAAIAAVAGTIAPKIGRNCSPQRPVAVLQIHGTADPVVPWEGGFTGGGGVVESVAVTIAGWVERNACTAKREVADLGGGVSRASYSSCREGTIVILYRVEGGGHTWPGGYQFLPKKIIGQTNRSWDASQAIWDFFMKHPMNESGDAKSR